MKTWLWRAWTANRERIADCGTARADTKERATDIARFTVAGPHRAKVVDIQVEEIDEPLADVVERQADHITHLVMAHRGKDWYEDVVALRTALGEACDMLERTIDELAAHESDPAMMDGHRAHLARWRAVK